MAWYFYQLHNYTYLLLKETMIYHCSEKYMFFIQRNYGEALRTWSVTTPIGYMASYGCRDKGRRLCRARTRPDGVQVHPLVPSWHS